MIHLQSKCKGGKETSLRKDSIVAKGFSEDEVESPAGIIRSLVREAKSLQRTPEQDVSGSTPASFLAVPHSPASALLQRSQSLHPAPQGPGVELSHRPLFLLPREVIPGGRGQRALIH